MAKYLILYYISIWKKERFSKLKTMLLPKITLLLLLCSRLILLRLLPLPTAYLSLTAAPHLWYSSISLHPRQLLTMEGIFPN